MKDAIYLPAERQRVTDHWVAKGNSRTGAKLPSQANEMLEQDRVTSLTPPPDQLPALTRSDAVGLLVGQRSSQRSLDQSIATYKPFINAVSL